ncbi:uncharacterized protein TNCV_165011 [Trichonephila clavipes]|nr:uncharacterized protein TNCV_165011 [Trichonephila clavipes]
MYCRREALIGVLGKLSKISESSDKKASNFMTILILSLPAIYPVLQVILFDDDPWLSQFETYGYDIESHTLKIMYLSTKFFLYALVHPTFTCLVTLLQCVLCQRCCSLINELTLKVQQVSPEDFDSSKQMDFLRFKAKIDDVFEDLQHVFSVPSFFVTVINFSMCGAMIGWLLFTDASMLKPHVIVEIVFYIVIDFSSLIILLWVTGNVPVELKKLKSEFYKKVLHFSSEEFGPSEQIEILRQKPEIDDILENLQDISSLTYFPMIMSNLFTCCSYLGINLIGNYSKVIVVKAVFYGKTNLASFIVILWTAGSLPVDPNKVKDAFYKRAPSRFLIVFIPEERHNKREILDKTDFVLNGCSIFPYTRNSILAVIGTLLTYSLLICQN